MCTHIEICVAAFMFRQPGVSAFIRQSCVSVKRNIWKSDRSGISTLPGIVKLSALLYYTLDTCASNPEDKYAYNQCIPFTKCKLIWKIRLLILIDWFFFDGSVFQRALRIFSNAMSRNSCCKYNIARYRFANFFTCLYQQVFRWVINKFMNRKWIEYERDRKYCW